MNRAIALLSVEQSPFSSVLPLHGQPRGLGRFALTQSFHANLVGLAPEEPPIEIADAGAEFHPAAIFVNGDEVALLQGGHQFAGVPAVAVGFDGHAPDGFGQCGQHNLILLVAPRQVRAMKTYEPTLGGGGKLKEERKGESGCLSRFVVSLNFPPPPYNGGSALIAL
jgi:hypothetical protein